MADVVINKFGKMQGWTSITVNMMGRDVEGITKISYDDNSTKENVYGAGDKPVGRSRGNYEAKATLGLYKEEVDGIKAALASGKRIQDVAPFDIVVQYELDGEIRKDIIHNCEFTNNAVDVSQGDGTISTDHELIVSHITWGAI